jgi:hypothetical protein
MKALSTLSEPDLTKDCITVEVVVTPSVDSACKLESVASVVYDVYVAVTTAQKGAVRVRKPICTAIDAVP